MTVKTQRIYSSGRTTRRLTMPLAYRPAARAIAGGLVVAIVCLAFLLDAIERRPAAAEAQPVEARIVYVYVVATPTPPLAKPAAAAEQRREAPTSAPAPTAAPTEAPAAPAYVELASVAPEPAQPLEAPAAAWHPPLARPGCGDWHPPMPYPADC